MTMFALHQATRTVQCVTLGMDARSDPEETASCKTLCQSVGLKSRNLKVSIILTSDNIQKLTNYTSFDVSTPLLEQGAQEEIACIVGF